MGALPNHHTALDAMVLREKRVISYRTLSSELSMSTSEAQACLLEYCNSRSEKLLTTWAITLESDSVRRTALVQGVRPLVKDDILRVAVWAVAPSSSAKTTNEQACIQTDRSRELQIVKRKAGVANELRDNTWNQIKSNSSGWNAGGAAAEQREHMEALSKERSALLKKKQDGGIVAKVKAEAAARGADRRKRLGASKNSSVQFSRSNSKGPKKEPPFRPNTSEGETPKSNAFRSLGDSLLKKQRPTSAPAKGKPAQGKKTRRIIEVSDEEDNSSDDDDNEMKQQREAMEAEAREAELAEKERSAFLENVDENTKRPNPKSLLTSAKKSETISRSPVRPVVETETKKRSRGAESGRSERQSFGSRSRKRSFAESTAEEVEPLRKKYKAIEVDITDRINGYVTTRRVTKYYDENGNEKPADVVHVEDKSVKENLAHSQTKEDKKKDSSTSMKKIGNAEADTVNGAEDGEKKMATKRNVGKAKKNNNKSILSFFGKKT